MMVTHNFQNKLAEGEAVEAMLDVFFAKKYEIMHTTRTGQRDGIDRYFTDRVTGGRAAIDYKADWRAVQTGNAFIETTSVDTHGKPGWAVASKAAWILYYLPQPRKLYILHTDDLHRWLPLWSSLFPTAKAKNEGYDTIGILVPLEEFDQIARKIIFIPEDIHAPEK